MSAAQTHQATNVQIDHAPTLAKDGEYLTTRNMSPALLAAAPRAKPDASHGFLPEGVTLKDQVESLEKQVGGLHSHLIKFHHDHRAQGTAPEPLPRTE